MDCRRVQVRYRGLSKCFLSFQGVFEHLRGLPRMFAEVSRGISRRYRMFYVVPGVSGTCAFKVILGNSRSFRYFSGFQRANKRASGNFRRVSRGKLEHMLF